MELTGYFGIPQMVVFVSRHAIPNVDMLHEKYIIMRLFWN